MPTEQNTTGVGGAPLGVSDDTSSSTVPQPTSPVADQISDLGDILLEKNMDDVQSNDFMPVGQNDVAQLDSTNNLSETQAESTDISLDNGVTTSDTTIVADETSSQNSDTNTIDLGDIDLSGSASSNTDVISTDVISTDVISTDTVSTTLEDNTDSHQTENTENTITTESVVSENTGDSSEISMDSINLDDNTEVTIDETQEKQEITTENNVSNETNISENTQVDTNEQTVEVSDVITSDTTDIGGISLDGIELPSSPAATEESITNKSQGDNDISLENSTSSQTDTTTNGSTETSADTTTESIDFDALENIDLPESSSVDINGGDSNPSTETTTTDEVVEEPVMDLPEISLDSIETPAVPEVAVEEIQNEVQPTLEVNASEEIQPKAENTEAISESVASEERMVNELPVVEDVISQNSSIDALNIEAPIVNTSENTLEVAQQNVESISSEAAIELPNIDDKLANIAQIAEKVEEGIDLDSLVGPDEQKDNMTDNTQLDSSVTQTQDTAASVTQTPEVAAQPVAQDKKPLKMALVGMGIVAVLGAGYFGYKTVFPMGLGNSEPSGILSGDMVPDLYSGDAISGDTLSGDIGQNSGEILLDDILFGSTNSGDTDIGVLPDGGTDSNGNTDGQTPSRTLDDVKNDADELVSKARKLLIKATIAKNGPARISAFSIQKDVDSFVQTLANTTDITTLEASEKTLEQLSQRLTSLENRLNGSSN